MVWFKVFINSCTGGGIIILVMENVKIFDGRFLFHKQCFIKHTKPRIFIKGVLR